MAEATAAIPVHRVRYLLITLPFAAVRWPGYPRQQTARLACLNHAASVRSEPGSNPSVSDPVSQANFADYESPQELAWLLSLRRRPDAPTGVGRYPRPNSASGRGHTLALTLCCLIAKEQSADKPSPQHRLSILAGRYYPVNTKIAPQKNSELVGSPAGQLTHRPSVQDVNHTSPATV